MIEKTKSSGLSSKRKTIDPNQFDHFWEIKCPSCGRMIDLEVLVNLMKKRGRGK